MANSDNVQRTALTAIVFLVTLAALITPFFFLANGASGTFSASAVVANVAPSALADSGQTITLAAGTAATVYLFFNATDANGNGDLNDTTAQVAINMSGETTRTSSSCSASTVNSSTRRYNCTVSVQYYDAPGSWTINASVKDNSSALAQDYSNTVTINNLDAVSVVTASISFSGSAGASDVAGSTNPQKLNNTGNQNYTSINVTGYNFALGANYISVGNVSLNSTDSGGFGQALVNATEVLMVNSSLPRGATSTRSQYFWLDIPSGVGTGTYSAQASWALEANT